MSLGQYPLQRRALTGPARTLPLSLTSNFNQGLAMNVNGLISVLQTVLLSTDPLCLFFRNVYLLIWLSQVLVAACGIKFLDQGLNPGRLHWEHGVLATGPPGKSPSIMFLDLRSGLNPRMKHTSSSIRSRISAPSVIWGTVASHGISQNLSFPICEMGMLTVLPGLSGELRRQGARGDRQRHAW